MASTAWTAPRTELVSELAKARAEVQALRASLDTQRERNRRTTDERDHLRRRLTETETRRLDLETEVTDLRKGYDRVTALLTAQQAEVTAAASTLAQTLTILRRPHPVADADQNRADLLAALKEKP